MLNTGSSNHTVIDFYPDVMKADCVMFGASLQGNSFLESDGDF